MRYIRDLHNDYVPGSYAYMIANELKREKIKKSYHMRKVAEAKKYKEHKNERMG